LPEHFLHDRDQFIELISIKAVFDYSAKMLESKRTYSCDMKHTRTWILVADGGRARILETTGKRQDLHLVTGSQSCLSNPPSHELGRDAPGRVYESVGHARHAVEPRSDPHTALEALFASQLATMLADHLAKDDFDRLVVVAPPVMLGNLRKMIKAEVRDKIIAEIDKDLTHVPNNEIASLIEDVIII
jgi:protein required for attachment to host cells